MSGTDLERCKKNLRSVLLASKGGLNLSKVPEEYRKMFEEEIPFRNFNCQTLEMFLRSNPEVCSLRDDRGVVVVDGVCSQATSHIQNMVQQTGKKRGGAAGWRDSQRPCLARVNPQEQLRPFSGNKQRQKHFQPPSGIIGPVKPSPVKGKKAEFKVPGESLSVWRDRVVFILRDLPAGADRLQVEALYQAKYRETLPGSWSKALSRAGLIDVDTENRQNSQPVIQLSQWQTEQAIPSIRRPVGRLWDIMVRAVDCRRQEAWVTLQDPGYKQTRNKLQVQLFLKHHSGQSYNGEPVLPGQYFSAEVREGDFRRVQVNKVDRVNFSCSCFLIDFGTETEVSWKSLVLLHPDCRTIPVQALKVGLAGFNNYTNSRFAEFVMNKLEGKRFMGREVEGSTYNIPQLRIFDGNKKSEVEFLDQIVSQMKGMNLDKVTSQMKGLNLGGVSPNKGMKLENVTSQMKGMKLGGISKKQKNSGVIISLSLEPQPLPEEGDFYECNVSHVVSPAEIWVQPHSAEQEYDRMKRQISAFYNRYVDGQPVQYPELGMIVAVGVGKDWFRAKIIFKMGTVSPIRAGKDFLVRLVDTGKLEIVNVGCIRSLEKSFALLPVQAVKVILEGIERSDELTNILLSQMCLGRSLVGHVTRREGEEIFLCLYDNSKNMDVNINHIIEKLMI